MEVIVFASQDNAQKLLSRVSTSTSRTRFTWIASDAWGDQIPAHLYPVAHGMLAILPLAKHSQDFDDYFTALTPLNNPANPWFVEYARLSLIVLPQPLHSEWFEILACF